MVNYCNRLKYDCSPILCLIAGAAVPSNKAEDPEARATPSVYEVQRDEFQKIMLTLEMMQDHLPGSYLDAINQL